MRAFAVSFPDLCQLSSVGTSRGGEDLPLLVIGDGPLKMVVAAGSHPNEPIGGQTIITLAEYLFAHPTERERATWYLMPSSDPDGLQLNERWLTGTWPPTMEAYHRGFYRPDGPAQPDWTFPFDDGTAAQLPETRALMEVIDTAKADAVLSLHSSDSGGCFYMVTRGEAEFVDILAQAAAGNGLPLEAVPSGCIGLESPGDGVFVLPTPPPPITGDLGDDVEWRPAGVSSVHYAARRNGALGVVPEVPMWRTTPISLPAEDAARLREAAAELCTGVLDRVEEASTCSTPYLPAVRDVVKILRFMARVSREHPDQSADQDLNLLVPLRAAGMLLSHLDAQLAANPLHPVLLQERDLVEEQFSAWLRAAEHALQPEPISLAQVVGYQLDTILGVARTLAG
ncbi:M14 family zinc carboxypeptidase [Streptomyces sp. NPDC088755]|uniref:M14 family zinc carboxypeptidase n=1 Tax=Streptomyces sp. NPDC088755 TaxID=3365888 RepID=UPI00381EB5DE